MGQEPEDSCPRGDREIGRGDLGERGVDVGYRVYQWEDVSEGFRDGLILGNGASIAFDTRFRYPSLKAKAEEANLITPDVLRVFSHLNTPDFELVLRILWHASEVNKALGVADRRTTEAYSAVREALVQVIGSIHPRYGEVEDRLRLAGEFMQHFSTVASLNYDLLVYWAFLLCNAETPNRFKDCFVGGTFEHDWGYLRKPYGRANQATFVVYPHGNLALISDIHGRERKVNVSDDATLLEAVFRTWRDELATPLFVSEGTSAQKLAAIHRSPYLTSVYYDILMKDVGESVVLLGWSLGSGDEHILDALSGSSIQQIAVAVDPDADDLDVTCATVAAKIRNKRPSRPAEVVFFDRESPGCWISR